MNEVLGTIVVLVLSGAFLAAFLRGFTALEQRLMLLSFGAHLAAGVAQVYIAKGLYNGGDNLTYMIEGSLLARAIELDPERFGRLWLDTLLQRPSNESIEILGAGSSTGSMVAITAALALVFRYSLFGACLFVAMIAFFGKFFLYRVFRELFPKSTHTRLLIAVFLVPSVVFWSSGIQKEALVVAAIGPLWLGIHRLLRGHYARGAVLLIAIIPVALLKAYTLFALVVAGSAWIGLDRLQVRAGGTGPVRVRPIYLLVSAALIYGGVIALGQIYPHYSLDNIGEDLARHQGLGAMTTNMMTTRGGGGSHYVMGDEGAMSLQKQIVFIPLAAATAFFRPFPFEANNGLAFLASLEVLVLTILLLIVLVRTGPRRAFTILMSNPVLAASIMFAVLLGMGVGLATTNFGSLSRYRMPLMPFYAAVVLLLSRRQLVTSPGQPALKTRLTLAGHAAAAATTLPQRSRLTGPRTSN